mmetsp:Transcript_31771/g.62052  ORF Transcript_31771/g.62052 Transcript_31771/m.62052 type:complete len:90 (-) Transcript_31771:1728-1997(-)
MHTVPFCAWRTNQSTVLAQHMYWHQPRYANTVWILPSRPRTQGLLLYQSWQMCRHPEPYKEPDHFAHYKESNEESHKESYKESYKESHE